MTSNFALDAEEADEAPFVGYPARLTRESLIVPVIEEALTIRKRTVDQGGFRISKMVTHRQETVDEALLSRTVLVERRQVGRLLPSMEIPPTRQEGDTLIIPVVEEVLVTEKRLMLKEELHITQTDAMLRNPVKVTLRSETVLVEPLAPLDPSSKTIP